MLHIVFQAADVELLEKVKLLDETLNGEVIQIKDDWGVGPLNDLEIEEGWQARKEWWRTLLIDSPYGDKILENVDDRITAAQIVQKLEEDDTTEAWLWLGQNQHDVVSYFWLMRQLKKFQGRIIIVFLNNLPFINEKGQLFYPKTLSEILPKEILKAKKLARPITPSEFEVDADEWTRMCNENAMVRILEGGKKIVGKEETYFDDEILKNINNDWQKANRVLMNTLHRMNIKTGDVFLMARIKNLIVQNRIEVLGDVSKGWKEFDIKLSETNISVNNI